MSAGGVAEPAAAPARDIARGTIRGSSLLLTGRVIALAVLMVAQVIVVRHLSTDDYGGWAYAIAAVALLKSFSVLGLDRSVARFASIYHQRGDRGRMLGLVVLVLVATSAACLVLTTALFMFPATVSGWLGVPPGPLKLLSVLIFLVPLDAVDTLLEGFFACFGRARTIFYRKHILEPLLKLAAVSVGLLSGASALALAWGYLAASVIGILVYARQMWTLWRRHNLLAHPLQVRLPVAEVFRFTGPMLVADLSRSVMYASGALALGRFSSLSEVALFTAALPLATNSQIVLVNFSLLYTSAASRLAAKGDLHGINALYWRTAVWIAVLTFPIFVLTCGGAGWLIEVLYGARYKAAAGVLAVLALGEFVGGALGLNGLTLRVVDRASYLVSVSLLAAALTIALNLVLVPRFGAVGAAIATSTSAIVFSVLKQIGLSVAAGLTVFDRRSLAFYAGIVLSAVGVVLAGRVFRDQPAVLVALAMVASLLFIARAKRALMVSETFPELRRVPVLGGLLA